MFDVIQIEVVLIVSGIIALEVVQLVFQLCLHLAILRLGVKHRFVFAEIGRENN